MYKWPISKSISSAAMHAIKLTVNHDTPRQFFSGQIFDIRLRSKSLDLQSYGVTRSRPGSPVYLKAHFIL